MPSATCLPGEACSSVTVPANGARSTASIFMASSTISTWSAWTWSPSLACTATMVPGIGAVTAPSPATAAWSAKTSGRSEHEPVPAVGHLGGVCLHVDDR